MKFATAVVLALVLLSVEGVLVKHLGLSVTRIDVTVAIVAFLALRASLLEGATASFAVGYLLDLMGGHSTGLYTFLAVFLFLVCRLAASSVDVRSPVGFAIFAAGADFIHTLLAVFFSWLISRDAAFGSIFSSIVLQVALTGAAALALYPLLRRFERRPAHAEWGTLR
ncbi:MAG TPA: hypothetical protein VF947_06940 [Myxococcales bacterium]